jgi:hypothetical protein
LLASISDNFDDSDDTSSFSSDVSSDLSSSEETSVSSEDSDLDSIFSILNYKPFQATELFSEMDNSDLVEELDTG